MIDSQQSKIYTSNVERNANYLFKKWKKQRKLFPAFHMIGLIVE